MGMFDTIKVSLDKLPVSDEEREMLKKEKNLWWQTKDFECVLTEIYITDEGELKVNYPEDDGLLGIMGSLRRANERLEMIPFHGVFHFYTLLDNNGWMEFEAKFTNGKLDAITRAPNQ